MKQAEKQQAVQQKSSLSFLYECSDSRTRTLLLKVSENCVELYVEIYFLSYVK